jgi:hypothetical protein
VIDQDPPHEPRRHAVKVRTTLPTNPSLLNQLEVCLMDQGGGLKRVILPLSTHVADRQATQLFVDERDQPGLGLTVSMAQLL